jgi:putative nucleotidyltransferase with HDIG domain
MSKVLFQVSLKFMPIHDILQWIDMNRISCVVNIELEQENEIVLYMEGGKIIFASSQRKGLRFGEHLVAAGALTEMDLVQAMSESRAAGLSITRYLVDNSLVTAFDLIKIFSQQLEKILLEIFASSSGSVTVNEDLPETLLNGPIHLDTGRTVFDAVRVFDERNRDTVQRNDAIEALNKRLYDEEFQLPVLPSILMQLISLMEDESTTFQDMAKLIMTDQVLISRILKIANSPLYGGTGQVDSIHFAIVKLGMREIMNIITGIKLNAMQYGDLPQERLQEILDDALRTAFVANGLARHCRLDPEEAFLGGLLLDLGKTVILSVAKDFDVEQEILDDLLTTRHAELGALIAKKWNYPESIQSLIRYHHNKNFGGMVNKTHALIQLADQVVFAGGENGVDTGLLDALSLSSETVAEVYQAASESFNQVKSL